MILEKRENIYVIILNLLPYIILILFIMGCLSLIYGISKWKQFQKEIDEQTVLKTKEQRINLEKMTPSEIVEKAFLEDENYDEINKQIFINSMKNEDMYFGLIKSELYTDYEVFQNIKVGSCQYDIIAMSKNSNVDKIYELKMIKKNINYSDFIKMVKIFKDMANCYRENTNRNVVPNLVFIITNNEFEDIVQNLKVYSEKCADEEINVLFIYEYELLNKGEQI